MRLSTTAVLVFLLSFCSFRGSSQDSTTFRGCSTLPERLLSRINKKSQDIQQKLGRQTEKYLAKLEKQENKLKKQLWKKDSAAAKTLFGDVNARYAQLQSTTGLTSKFNNVYSPHLDSLQTVLNFLSYGNLLQEAKLQTICSSFKDLQLKLNASDRVRKELIKRQQALMQQLREFGMIKNLGRFSKDVFYYQQQIQEYKQLWEDPSRIERKLVELVSSLPQFKDFFASNSQLGSLFALGGSSGAPPRTMAGLQTGASVQQAFNDRFGKGVSVTQILQRQLQNMPGQPGKFTKELRSYTTGAFGNSGGDIKMPEGFKPNSQHTKSFLQRIEVAANVQSQRARNYFPATTDVAASAGYKLNDHLVAGIGLSYKLGLGLGWNHVAFSHQGIGLRSFVDHRLKGSFFLSAGYEQNYVSQFRRIAQLKNYSAWQSSGLVGLSKKYRINNKLKGDMKLLWDYLSYRQVPRTQPLVFRVGYILR
jgi:hypothetical protein